MDLIRRAHLTLPLALALAAAGCGDLFAPKSEGERLWRKHCADCHGLDAAGNTPRFMGDIWADLLDDSWHTGGDEGSIMSVVREGVFGKMPANDELTDAELRAVVRWLYRLRGETSAYEDATIDTEDIGSEDSAYADEEVDESE